MLAYVRPSDSLAKLQLAKAFPESEEDQDQTTTSVMDQIRREWEHKFLGFGPGKNPLRWREARAMYEIVLPDDGWFIDIGHSDTIAALNRAGGPLQGPFHPTQRVTLANLYDENRRWSCGVATLLRSTVLYDGSYAHGISYRSKHGNDGECWAFWLRQIDDGKVESAEPLRVSGPQEIEPTSRNKILKEAADTFGLCLY